MNRQRLLEKRKPEDSSERLLKCFLWHTPSPAMKLKTKSLEEKTAFELPRVGKTLSF